MIGWGPGQYPPGGPAKRGSPKWPTPAARYLPPWQGIAVSAKAMSMWRSEFRVRSPRLGEIWIEGCSSPVSGPDGSVIWHGYIADITARKRKEEAFHNIQRQLRESQQMARLGSWSWDADTGRIWWSDEVYDLIGQDPARGPLSLAAFLERVHPQDRHFAAARLRAWEAGENRFAGDFRVMRPNGETIWIHSQARAVRDETGDLTRTSMNEKTTRSRCGRAGSDSDPRSNRRRWASRMCRLRESFCG